ncbi:hypothetical protein DFJ73DRAFT_926746 [Zopfochytrium polystomum]|nr:hypothetical protein DFJ73DRAFT_926746 [Zopfochytrium polystomum]
METHHPTPDTAVNVARARTRFVVPFPYSVNRRGEPNNSSTVWTWTDATPADPIWRSAIDRNYFTLETEATRFTRSRTLVLRPPIGGGGPPPMNLEWFPPFANSIRRRLAMIVVGAYMVLFESLNSLQASALLQGFLVVDLEFPGTVTVVRPVQSPANTETPDRLTLADVLKVNELFKYYRLPYQGHSANGHSDMFRGCRFDWRKEALLDPEQPGYSRDAYLGRWDWMLQCPIDSVYGTWYYVVPQEWISQARHFEESSSRRGRLPRGWLTFPHDRAFVWTAVAADPAHLKDFRSTDADSSHWVHLVNADPPACSPCHASPYELEWIRPRTYRRWSHLGSQHGFAADSAAFWTPPDGSNQLFDSFFGVHFDLALTVLYSRVVLLHIGAGLGSSSYRSSLSDFLPCVELLMPLALSLQQQGHEMEALLRAAMDTDRMFENLARRVYMAVKLRR